MAFFISSLGPVFGENTLRVLGFQTQKFGSVRVAIKTGGWGCPSRYSELRKASRSPVRLSENRPGSCNVFLQLKLDIIFLGFFWATKNWMFHHVISHVFPCFPTIHTPCCSVFSAFCMVNHGETIVTRGPPPLPVRLRCQSRSRGFWAMAEVSTHEPDQLFNYMTYNVT